MKKDRIFHALNTSFKMLSILAITATLYFVAVIISNLFDGDSPKLFGLAIERKYAIVGLLVCTVLHIGILRYIVHYMNYAWLNLTTEDRLELYYQLTGANHLLTQGSERFRDSIYNKGGVLIVRVAKDDPPSMLHWIIFFSAAIACIRFELSIAFIWSFVAGMTLAMLNWQIGSSWLVALADLGRQSNESLYFDDPDRLGPRYFGIISGPWYGMNANIFTFAAISVIDAFLRILPLSTSAFIIWAILETLVWILP